MYPIRRYCKTYMSQNVEKINDRKGCNDLMGSRSTHTATYCKTRSGPFKGPKGSTNMFTICLDA